MEATQSSKNEILINVHPFETRVALLHDGVAQEVHIERTESHSYTGNVYKGRVSRILPGMQAAFVDIGLERPGFLHVRDIRGLAPRLVGAGRDNAAGAGDEVEPDIGRLLHEGQSLLVQVVKDPISTKGARVTTELSFAARYLVMMPLSANVGVSQRIEDACERDRLKQFVDERRVELANNHGWIVRTAADGVDAETLARDMNFLSRVWELLQNSHQYSEAPALIYEELPLHIRTVRDLVDANVQSIHIDSRATYQRVGEFIDRFIPTYNEKLSRYEHDVPMFEKFGVEEEIDRALRPRVELKSGGHLVIEQTEAMTTIDVNTGGFVGGKNLEDTIFRTNMEAAAAIPRQLRLRNLGGIIVIDFIDMEDEEHRRQVLRILEKGCDLDPARSRLSGLSSLGLVEMSRKRTRDSLARQLSATCPTCCGTGMLKTPESMCFEIYRAIMRDANLRNAAEGVAASPNIDRQRLADRRAQRGREYLVRGSQAVVDRLLDEESENVTVVAAETGFEIRYQVEPSYSNEQFDIVLMQGLNG